MIMIMWQVRGGILCFAAAIGCGSVSETPHDATVSSDASFDTAPGCIAAPASLRHWWPAEGDARDIAGTLNGAITGGLAFANGRVGQAFSFDGVDDYIAVADLDALWPAASFSVEAWFRTSGGGIILRKYECGGTCAPSPASSFYSLTVRAGDGRLYWETRDKNDVDAPLAIISTAAVTDNAWHHAVGVWDATSLKTRLYLDGVSMTINLTANQAEGFANTDGEQDPVTIGAGTQIGTQPNEGWFVGLIDEVGFYDAALSADDVSALFGASAGKCAP